MHIQLVFSVLCVQFDNGRIKDSPRTIASVLASTRVHRCFIRVLPMIDKMDIKDSDLRKVLKNNPILAKMR